LIEHDVQQTITMRDILRARTGEAHERLHTHSMFADMFDGSLSRASYCRLMQRFHGFYAPLDQAVLDAIAGMDQGIRPYPYAKRATFLAQDLVDLGAATLGPEQSPQCKRVSEIVTPATLGGVLYVIEGATLGASQIDRAAQKLLGTQGIGGRSFWAWGRAQNRQRWSMANAYLEHLGAQGICVDDITRGAQQTFEALADWLAPLDEGAVNEGAMNEGALADREQKP